MSTEASAYQQSDLPLLRNQHLAAHDERPPPRGQQGVAVGRPLGAGTRVRREEEGSGGRIERWRFRQGRKRLWTPKSFGLGRPTLCDRMLLYDNRNSGNCYKVRLLFAHLGLEYERRELDVIDRSDRPEVLGGLNPALRVPTLVFDDGRVLAESNTRLFYFAQGSDYLPEDRFERAQVLQWMFFEQYSHEPFIAVTRFWAHAGITPSQSERETKHRGGVAALDAMEAHLKGGVFLVGQRYSIADIALYAYTHAASEGGFELEPYPAIWANRLVGDPSGKWPRQLGCEVCPGAG